MESFLTVLSGFSPESGGVLLVAALSLIASIFTAVFSVMLVYHWRRYNFRAHATPMALLLYFIVAVPATIVMLLSAFAYIQSL